MSWTTPVDKGGWTSTANASAYVSDSITLTVDRLYVAVFYMRCGTGDTIGGMTLGAGSSGSWTFGAEQLDQSGNNDRLGYFYKVATATETATITLTTNQGQQSNCLGEVWEIAAGEFDSTTPISQADFATTASAQTSLAVTLSPSPDSDSLSVASFGYRNNGAITPDSNFGELVERTLNGTGADAGSLETEYDLTPGPSTTCTATGSSAFWVGVHFEINAVAAATFVRPTLVSVSQGVRRSTVW